MKRPRDRGPDREAAEVRPFVPSSLSTILKSIKIFVSN